MNPGRQLVSTIFGEPARKSKGKNVNILAAPFLSILLANFLQLYTDGGLNYTSADLDEIDFFSRRKVLARSFAIKMEQMQKKYFFLHMTVLINANEGHNFVGQIFVKEKIAVIIDPDEMIAQFQSERTRSCDWLGVPLGADRIKSKDKVKQFFAGLRIPVIPRFPKDLESALFCRLKRFEIQKSKKQSFQWRSENKMDSTRKNSSK